MSIDAIGALAANPEMASLSSLTAVAIPQLTNVSESAPGAFQPLLSALTQLNTDIVAGEQGLRNVALGDLDNLHQSVMGMEKVRLSMQLLLQVRSRALDAYQELMRMQV